MRPVLKPVFTRVRRDTTTLQLGLPPTRGVVISAAGPEVDRFLALLDGSHTSDELLAHEAPHGLDRVTAANLLDELGSHGLLLDDEYPVDTGHPMTVDERDRLVRDGLAWDATSGIGGSRGVLGGRRRAWVDIRSSGRTGFALSTLLSRAGVGRLTINDKTTITMEDLDPLGASASDIGDSTSRAVYRRLADEAPSIRRTAAPKTRPNVTVLAPDAGVLDVDTIEDLMRASAVHLPIVQRSGGFVIGPLVAPGRNACLRCVEHIDAERDPAWPWIIAQLRTSIPTRNGGAYDTVVGTAAVAFACLQILTWIDGQKLPSLHDAVAHVMGPEAIPQIQAVSPHPACGCTWAGAVAAPARAAPSPTRTMAG